MIFQPTFMAKWEWIEKSFCLLEKIYRIGGVANNAMPLTLNSVVNLSNGIITEAPGLTVMRKSAAAAATDNFIFVFGGTNPTTARIYQHARNIGHTKNGTARYLFTT